MKKLFYAGLVMVFLLSACGGNGTSTGTQPPSTKAPVTQKPPTPAVVNPPGCTDSAAFVADVTVPDNANFKPGEKFNKIWRVRNTGTCTWMDQYTVVFYDGDQMGAPDSLPLDVTKPGATLDIAVEMTAPTRDAAYRADFELHNPAGETMLIDRNTVLWVIITVGGSAGSTGGGSNNTDPGAGSDTDAGAASGPGLVTSTCAFSVDPNKVTETITAVNNYRAQNGYPPYVVNADLATAAQAHSADMACNKLFVHTGSNGSTPASRVAATGYVASSVTENVYGSYPPLSGQGVVTWWATDQTDIRHNENLLSTEYTEIGIGYAFFNNFGYYVIDFATL
jgi:uncharacterized protein YkwD